jgi:hypothetical protein
MDAQTIEIGPEVLVGPAPSPLTRDYAEIARWGRVVGRLDAHARVLRVRDGAESAHCAAFRRSPIWTQLEGRGRLVFNFAYREAWTEWVTRCEPGRMAAAAG